MGMFKDIKKMTDQSKELSKQQGRPTSMLGRIKDTPNTLNQMSGALDDAMGMQADMQAQNQLLTTGTPGTATIKALQETGTLVNFNPQVFLDLEVAVEGKDPYTTQLTTAIPQMQIPMVAPGNKVGVRVDPADPSAIAIDWTRPQG
ncbi:MAG: hypothetical protein MUP97_05865 [Acidimicrobiia bacterium]|nr:hypothetical protein [Acidimicrobiia bacterium]